MGEGAPLSGNHRLSISAYRPFDFISARTSSMALFSKVSWSLTANPYWSSTSSSGRNSKGFSALKHSEIDDSELPVPTSQKADEGAKSKYF